MARARLTTTAHQFGDAFSAPELLENAKTTDPAVDVYAIGAVWFWLHAGRSPKGVTGIEDTIKEFDIDDPLRGLLHSCLLPSAKRPTSARVVEELRAAFRKQRTASQKDSASMESSDLVRRPEQNAKELERRIRELELERLEREREIRIVLKQQGPAARSGVMLMTSCHIENHGESHFVVEGNHCEARPNESYWRYLKMNPMDVTLPFPTVFKTNQVVKPGDIGQISVKITVEAVRAALTTAELPNPSEWLWTYIDIWIIVRCQARGVSREERKLMR
jgi:serine/threonine protein kinase